MAHATVLPARSAPIGPVLTADVAFERQTVATWAVCIHEKKLALGRASQQRVARNGRCVRWSERTGIHVEMRTYLRRRDARRFAAPSRPRATRVGTRRQRMQRTRICRRHYTSLPSCRAATILTHPHPCMVYVYLPGASQQPTAPIMSLTLVKSSHLFL